MNFPFQAVLFDMDGTITDSTPLHNAAWQHFAYHHLGEKIALDDPRLVPGRTIDVIASILGRPILDEEARALHDEKENIYIELAKGNMQPLPGLTFYIEYLKKHHIPLALVTNAPRMNVVFGLPELGLDETFDLILCAEDIKRGKPYPDPYLEACRCFNLPPSAALVHEDSPLGIQAGVAAGCPVAAILTDLPEYRAWQNGARWVAKDYFDWVVQIDGGALGSTLGPRLVL